jgi:hypothetical protein
LLLLLLLLLVVVVVVVVVIVLVLVAVAVVVVVVDHYVLINSGKVGPSKSFQNRRSAGKIIIRLRGSSHLLRLNAAAFGQPHFGHPNRFYTSRAYAKQNPIPND